MYSFQGIPYAEAPVGVKRFEVVGINRERWSSVRNTTKFTPLCIQMLHLGFTEEAPTVGVEDCLYMNIFTSSLDTRRKLPVIFYIHTGSFMYGGASYLTPGRLFRNNELVFVSFNYRVGAMGFLSTENEVVPGNMGLKDQVVALQWVRENIHLFGGDPNSVTLSGISSGAASTHLHYMSPLSAGLFHRGHSQSGCALNPWVLAENSGKKAKTLAVKLGCPTQDTRKMIECMKKKPAEDVVRGVKLFMAWRYNPVTPFGVVVEKNTTGAFLTDHPEELLKAGKFAQIPWISSTVDSEGLFHLASLIEPSSNIKELNDRWEELGAALLDFEGTVLPRDQPNVANCVRKFYIQNGEISERNLEKMEKMFGDRHFGAGIHLCTHLQAQYSRAPIYHMRYAFPAVFGVHDVFAPGHKFNGTGHGDDNILLYDHILRKLPLTKDEEEMARIYADFLVKYASGQDPDMGGIAMKAITNRNNMDFLHVRSPKNIKQERTQGFGNGKFWDSLPIAEKSSSRKLC
ncbi:venom carboxylesterase-6-like [Lutzomyia longipalpis]|uniref:venom carboxylesterase-6-like n=1 Tax=Lutzomyia longipalpis TaxID=7200 RepID=UPI0024840DE2|nr:venom carboxylesterase-6-like [Lutzomyia longipalpis]